MRFLDLIKVLTTGPSHNFFLEKVVVCLVKILFKGQAPVVQSAPNVDDRKKNARQMLKKLFIRICNAIKTSIKQALKSKLFFTFIYQWNP